jgi:hypothetical protein
LVEGLHRQRDAAWKELDGLCRPGVVELVVDARRRFKIDEGVDLLSRHTLHWIEHFVLARRPAEWDRFAGDDDGWREFRAYLLLKAGKLFLWDLGPPSGGNSRPEQFNRLATFLAGDPHGAASALGCQGRYEFKRYCRPLKQVPGDLIDFLWLNDEALWVLVADATGKSWPAHLLVQGLAVQWKSLATSPDLTPGDLMVLLQNLFKDRLPEGLFFDAVVARFDSNTVTVAPAGYARVLLRHGAHKEAELKCLGGGYLGIDYPVLQVGQQETWPFRPGDELTFATDGLYEHPLKGPQLGDVILGVLARVADGKSLHEDVLRALSYASCRDDPSDDISIATVRRR